MRAHPTSAAGPGRSGLTILQHGMARGRSPRALNGEDGAAVPAAGLGTPLTDERLKLAVFIDFDNIEIGVKTTLGVHFDIGAILEAIKERGEVITKVAYGDWKRAGDHSRLLTQHAIRMVQRNVTPGGDKNGADINLALDALEMALTHDHINAYVIVGGDSDFISLVEKLKQYDKKVFVVGGRAFTSNIMQKNCYEFIAYENLIEPPPSRRPSRGRATPGPEKERTGQQPLGNAVPLVERALQVLSDREVSPQLGLLKSTLLQLDSAFSERDYGASSFREFVEKLAQAGLVTLKQAGRSLLVEVSDTEAKGAGEAAVEVSPVVTAPADGNGHTERVEPPQAAAPAVEAPPTAPEPGTQASPAEGIHAVRTAFESAAGRVRWPMYVRNVKQLLRGIEGGGFDERRFGFGGIIDLLRACQREGILRLERDRQGVLRVFPGAALPRAVPEAQAHPVPVESREPVVPEVVAEPEPAPVVVEAEVVAESVTVEEGAGFEASAAETGEPAEAEAGAEPSLAAAEPAAKPRRRRSPSSGARKTAGTPRKPRAPRPRRTPKAS